MSRYPCPFCERWFEHVDRLDGVAHHLLTEHKSMLSDTATGVQCWCGNWMWIDLWVKHLKLLGGPVAHLLACALDVEDVKGATDGTRQPP